MPNDEDAAKLTALRAAVDVGIAAFERGDFVQFASVDELLVYLTELTDEVLYDETRKI